MANDFTDELYVIVLAAGKGTRMKSALPKVLHPLAGKPLLGHVLDGVSALKPKAVFVVTGHGASQIESWAEAEKRQLHWVEQVEQLGTAHAVSTVLPRLQEHNLSPSAKVLIVSGDVPLTSPETLNALCQNQSQFSLLTLSMGNPFGYGRVIRNSENQVIKIVEEKDATPEQKLVTEINTNVMILTYELLAELLPQVSNNNAQNEYYLPDLVGLAANKGIYIEVSHPKESWEVQGVNDKAQLHDLERLYQRHLMNKYMKEGLGIVDAARVDVRGHFTFGQDCILDVNVILEGKVVFGNNVRIGPNVHLKNVTIADNSTIYGFCDIEDAIIGEECKIGPYARVRPGCQFAKGSKLGNFVETKNAQLSEFSKINHLSYAGDCEIGARANIGAGTIFCNYDGVNKHKTKIGADVFVGSNSSLVAPVAIGQGATVGAGSTVTQDVPEDVLVVARARPRIIDDWQRPIKK